MANITLMGASYTDVPAVDLPQTGGGTVRFYENGGGTVVVTEESNSTGTTAVISVTDAVTLGQKSITLNGTYDPDDDSLDGYSGVTVNVANGASVTEVQNAYGTELVITSAQGAGPSATQHTITLGLSDESSVSIPVYYDNALIGTMITAYSPATWTYNGLTVYTAALDNVQWYDATPSPTPSIPLNTELIDFTKVTNGYGVYSDGSVAAAEWMAVSDYTPIDPSMTFTAKGNQWYYIGFYDSTQANLGNAIYIYDAATSTSGDVGTVILNSSNIPSGAAYTRITSVQNPDPGELSLIRTA